MIVLALLLWLKLSLSIDIRRMFFDVLIKKNICMSNFYTFISNIFLKNKIITKCYKSVIYLIFINFSQPKWRSGSTEVLGS